MRITSTNYGRALNVISDENIRLSAHHCPHIAGSGHSVKAKPFGAHTRALTFMAVLPA